MGERSEYPDFADIKRLLKQRIAADARFDAALKAKNSQQIVILLENLFSKLLTEENLILSRPERQRLFDELKNEFVSSGS